MLGLVLTMLVLFSVRTLSGQEKQPPSFRIESELVLVDLIVTDQEGNFLSDLSPEEIEVFEDGKRQKISSFHLWRLGSGQGEKTPPEKEREQALLRSLQRAGRARHTPRPHFIFLLDLPSLSFDSLQRMKESIRTFVQSQLTPEDRVMLATFTLEKGLRVDRSFTGDLASLSKALDHVPFAMSQERSFARFVEEVTDTLDAAQLLDPDVSLEARMPVEVRGAIRSALSMGRLFLADLHMRLKYTCEAISALGRHLRSIGGRKHIVFCSGGYPLRADSVIGQIIERRAVELWPDPVEVRRMVATGLGVSGRYHDLISEVQFAVNQLNRSQVSVYSIDARGLLSSQVNASLGGSGLRFYSEFAGQDTTAPQEFLTFLATGTGGLWFVDDNDLQRGVQQAYLDSHEYYLIGYVPSTKRKSGKFHRIKVKVKRPRLKLRYRRGYLEVDDKLTGNREVVNALKFPELFQEFPFRLEVSNQGDRLQVDMVIPTDALTFALKGKRYKCAVELVGALVDGSGKWAEDKSLFTERFDLEFNAEKLAQFRTHDVARVVAHGKASRGRYDLIVALREVFSGRIATSTQTIVLQ